MTLPDSARCLTILASGVMATVTATRRPRATRSDVKCIAPGDPALAERMQQVVRLARHTEARLDSRDQVMLSIEPAPARHERDWELAVVLADRMVRGLWQGADNAVVNTANGWSDHWEWGRIDGRTLDTGPPGALLGGADGLAYLGVLTGQADSSACVSTASAWFPLHSGGINDSLCRVDVSVYPLEATGADEEDTIAAPGLDPVQLLAVRQALADARHFDARALGRWRTVVRFAQPRFQGNSFELALVMADRLARGREFVPRARLIASGCSSAWHAGRVDEVEGVAAKCALILAQAGAGDRILLPRAWEAALAPDFAARLRAAGASLACIDRIGII